MKNDVPIKECISHIDLSFTGEADTPVEKMRIIGMPGYQSKEADGKQADCMILLTLSNGMISIHQLPSFEKLELLEINQILDFEPYQDSVLMKSVGRV